MINQVIAERLKNFFNAAQLKFTSVSGGSINYAYSFEAGEKKYFLKYNLHTKFPQIIGFEVEGLHAIAATNTINTPDIILNELIGDYEILVLPFIEEQQLNKAYWQQFGRQLAQMHENSVTNKFGWAHDNYLGSLQQSNKQHARFQYFLD